MMAYCVAVTLEGLVSDGALVEPKTKARFPLMLCEDDPAVVAAGGTPPDNPRAPFAQGSSQEQRQQQQQRQKQGHQKHHQQRGGREPDGLPMASTMGGPKRRRLLPWGRREVVEKRYTESGPGDAATPSGVPTQGAALMEDSIATVTPTGTESAVPSSAATRTVTPTGAATVTPSDPLAGVPGTSQAGWAAGLAAESSADGNGTGSPGRSASGVPPALPGSPGAPEGDTGSPLSLVERRAKCQVRNEGPLSL